MRTTLTIFLALCSWPVPAQNCGVLYVDANAAGANTGASWADAYTNLQDAIDAAAPGGQLWVAAGAYLPARDTAGNAAPFDERNKTFFINKDIQLYGGFAGGEQELSQRDAAANLTILSGDIGATAITEDNAYHVLWLSAVGPACILDGFTISGGYADGAGNDRRGGGVFLGHQPPRYAAPLIRNSIFENNNATYGGGLHTSAESWAGPPIRVENCIFRNNTASSGAGAYFWHNGSMETGLELIGLELVDNNSGSHGGGLYALGYFRAAGCRFESNEANRGAGANVEWGRAVFENCTFIGNSSLRNGGGLRIESSIAELINCHFLGNEANVVPEGGFTSDAGGGFFYRGTSSTYARLANCVFSGNKGENGAGFAQASVFLSGPASSELDNCTFAGNNGPSAVSRLGGSLALENSIVFGNDGTPLVGGTAQNCIIEGGFGPGNLDADPLFVNMPAFNLAPIATGNLQLQPSSPAIGQGDNNLLPVGIITDAANNHRLIDCQLDMGAFEFGAATPDDIICYADADGDGLGDASAPRLSCASCPAGFVLNNGDCGPGDPAVTDELPPPAAIQLTAEFCRGEPGDALRTLSAEAQGEVFWILLQAPPGSRFAGMEPLAFGSGQANSEFSVGPDRVVMCDSPANDGEPVFGTWVFEAYYETAGGCRSATAQGFTARVNEGGARGRIVASDSLLCPGEAAVLFFEATAGEGLFDITANGQFTLALPWAAEAGLYDVSGKLVRRERYGPGNHLITMHRLPDGAYFLVLRNAKCRQALRLAKATF